MDKTQLQRVMDLSRLNGNGWFYFSMTIAAMVACVIYFATQTPIYEGDRWRGVVYAFLLLTCSINLAAGLRRLGFTFWKDGLDPYLGNVSDVADDGGTKYSQIEGPANQIRIAEFTLPSRNGSFKSAV